MWIHSYCIYKYIMQYFMNIFHIYHCIFLHYIFNTYLCIFICVLIKGLCFLTVIFFHKSFICIFLLSRKPLKIDLSWSLFWFKLFQISRRLLFIFNPDDNIIIIFHVNVPSNTIYSNTCTIYNIPLNGASHLQNLICFMPK